MAYRRGDEGLAAPTTAARTASVLAVHLWSVTAYASTDHSE